MKKKPLLLIQTDDKIAQENFRRLQAMVEELQRAIEALEKRVKELETP
jgi:uncharacterized protein YlxW (UPF0749 family)